MLRLLLFFFARTFTLRTKSSSATAGDVDGQSPQAVYTNFRLPTYDGKSDLEFFARRGPLAGYHSSSREDRGRSSSRRLSRPAKVYCSTLTTADILKEDGAAKVLAHPQTGFDAIDYIGSRNVSCRFGQK